MDPQQRFLRRKFLLDMFDQILREASYHKKFDEEEDLEFVQVWDWDEEEGENASSLGV